jgi:uncharacterized membrane protein YgdD (TMEM256/DUF423 family)
MSYRFWVFAAATLGMLGVLAGSVGAHALLGYPPEAQRVFDTALRYHIMHVPALLAVAWLASLDARRKAGGGWLTQIAGVAFLAGVALFSGVLYLQTVSGVSIGLPLPPLGGFFLIFGWVAMALAAFGLPEMRGPECPERSRSDD